MVYYIYHHFNGQERPPVPEAKKYIFTTKDGHQFDGWSVRPRSIIKFVEKYGPIKLIPPNEYRSYWMICVTDASGSFGQR